MSKDIKRGTVVDYHGSVTSDHGEKIVLDIDVTGRLTLADRNFPHEQHHLRHVRQASVTPTGEIADLCPCGHEHSRTWQKPERCGVYQCKCVTHRKPVPLETGTVVIARPWQRGRELEPQRGFVVDATPEHNPDYIVVWFPKLGVPAAGRSEMFILRSKIDPARIYNLAEMPPSWITRMVSIVRTDPAQTWLHGWPAHANIVLSRAHRANLAARRESEAQRRQDRARELGERAAN
ncbi:DUF6409 family protein [Saccharothrix hoggarensis]|uniref:DUF6409 family protein n=1 Tax=Saccharothrix hoggarensis TaxID=913853 RepID=A0ABW3QNG6_9PSEU